MANRKLSITITRRDGFRELPDYFVGTVTEGDTVVAEVESNFLWLAVRRTKKALRLYKRHGIEIYAA